MIGALLSLSCPVVQPHRHLQNHQTFAWALTLAVINLEQSSPMTLSGAFVLFLFGNYWEPFPLNYFI